MKNKSSLEMKKLSVWYYLVLFTLAAIAVVVTFIPYLVTFSPFWQKVLSTTGTVIYVIFLLDFIYFWYRADWERNYVRDNWVSLVALLSPLAGLKGLKGIKGLKGLKGAKVIKARKLGKKVKTKKQALNEELNCQN